MKADYIAALEATKDVTWLCSLLTELGLTLSNALTTPHVDNRSAISLTDNPALHARSKHIGIWYHVI